MRREKNAIAVFLTVTVVLSSICYYIYNTGGEEAQGITSLLMWCPGIAGIIVKKRYYKKESILGFQQCSFRYLALGIVIPVVYLTASYGIYWLIKPESYTGAVYTDSVLLLVVAVFSGILTCMGEEIGWRGFLLPRMTLLFGSKRAIVISGIIWALWHFPLMINGAYQSGTPLWYKLPVFTIEVVLITAVLAWLRVNSESIWPAILLHASHNYMDQLFMDPLTGGKGSAFFVGETGFLTVICLSVIVLMLYQSRIGRFFVIGSGIVKKRIEKGILLSEIKEP